MIGIPTLAEPAGDPTGIRAGAQRLQTVVGALKAAGQQLSTDNQEATRIWESNAQRIFTLLASGMADVINGSSNVANDFSGAINRYANTIESCQNEVRNARQRLQALAAATPLGMLPDQNAITAIVNQANNAIAIANQAARHLTATANQLIGPTNSYSTSSTNTDVNASFISHAHGATSGHIPTHPNSSFDVQAAQIQQQLTVTFEALIGFASQENSPTPSALYPSFAIVGGSSFSSDIVMLPASSANLTSGSFVIGGSSFSDSITILPPGQTAPAGPNVAIIGGATNYSNNPVMVLAQAASDISTRSAERIWESVFPGVPPPDLSAGGILNQILEVAGPQLTPLELQAIGIVSDGLNYNIRTQLLPPEYELVGDTRYF